MMFEKDGKIYKISESETKWNVKLDKGALTLEYSVSKDICASIDELKEYIMREEIF